MSNPNMEPMPFRRQFGTGSGGIAPGQGRSLAELESTSKAPHAEGAFVDASGFAIIKPAVTGACRKCGYPGHLPFQCRNFIQLKPNSTVIDIESTSSESDMEDTPLVQSKKILKKKKSDKDKKKKDKKKKDKKKKEKKEKKAKKRRRSSSSSDSDEEEKKRKRRRRHSSESSDSDSRKKKKSSKKSKKRRRHSSSSSSDSD